MSWKKRLESEKWIFNEDIPNLIARAGELQQQESDRLEKESSPQEVHRISQELSIEDRFMEQAIVEYKGRLNAPKPTPKNMSVWIILILLLGIVGLMMIVLSMFPSPEKERIVERENITKIIIEKEIVHEKSPPVEPVVVEKIVYVDKVKKKAHSKEVAPKIEDSPPEKIEVPPEKIETPPEKIEDPPPKQDISINKPKDIVSLPPPLSSKEESIIKKLFVGKWVLVSYLLLDGDEYMEVPITPSPMDLVEHWSIEKDSYRRVMDSNLSFSARYSFLSSPFSFDAITGHNFLVHAQKVVSSIPGIRRPEDFFHGEIVGDTMVLWYLGPKFQPSRKPTQGHKYERK